jgi:seryl-tRNA(Sec) selenium transferase
MEAGQRRAAKEQMAALMQAGHRWRQEAATQAEIPVSRSTHLVRREIKERKATIDAELHELWQRVYRIEARQDQEWRKQERSCCQQREVLRALENLTYEEREMSA